MSILLNDNLDIAAVKPVDSRYGPHASIAAANAAISLSRRYQGLTVGVMTNGVPVEYWYHSGINDTDLILKTVEIDQVVIITKTLTLSTEWQDTGIQAADLTTGTYAVQLYANDLVAGGSNNNEYYSGMMSWYDGNTDSAMELPTDEIILHRAGGSGDGALYLRTYRTEASNPANLKLQMYSNTANATFSNYVFKFRRLL